MYRYSLRIATLIYYPDSANTIKHMLLTSFLIRSEWGQTTRKLYIDVEYKKLYQLIKQINDTKCYKYKYYKTDICLTL